MQQYNERLGEGAIMDSQDQFDHGVCPMDPNVMEYWKKGWCYHLIRGIRHADAQCPGGTLVSGSGLYMLLR